MKNIIFDFGGVLVDWNARYFYRSYFADDERMEYFLAHICTNDWIEEQDRGRTYDEGMRVLQEQYPEWSEAIGQFKSGWPTMLHDCIAPSVEMLKQLKANGYGIYGLTNWSAENIGVAFERFPFFSLFDGIVVSGRERIIKPDERLYRILFERYNLNPEECVFLDDREANIRAGQRLGMRGIVFTNAADAMKQLREMGVRI